MVEGIYANTGEICPLDRIVELRAKYKLRLILDESVSFGTLGKQGKGLTEMLNIDKTEVDLICGSLETSVESVGGFCVGTHFIVEHQRLSGLGYCFSASQPPFLTQAAISALDIFEKDPSIFEQLRQVATKIDESFKHLTRLELGGDPISPVKHLYLKDEKSYAEAEETLRKISDQVRIFIAFLFSFLNFFSQIHSALRWVLPLCRALISPSRSSSLSRAFVSQLIDS